VFRPDPRFARVYLKVAARAERRGAAEHRRELLSGLRGRVCEVGAGPGLNFRHYPDEVETVLALEPEPTLRAWAAAEAADVPAVTVLDGVAERLPAADGSMDAVVFALVLCTVSSSAAALAEAARVLRPGGEVRVYEHVRSTCTPLALTQDLLAPVWSHLAGGCHPNRDPLAALRSAGFGSVESRRFSFSPLPGLPGVAHVLGRAVRP
jgi:ubiquinone/menaquinone biosynthesis C-methylase UbiE